MGQGARNRARQHCHVEETVEDEPANVGSLLWGDQDDDSDESSTEDCA